MKKLIVFAVAFLVCGATIFSHEKGALVINIELPLGLTIPQIKLNMPGTQKGSQASLGIDGGIRATVNYYFLPWISLNAGLAFGGMGDFAFPVSNITTAYTAYVPLNGALFFGVPFGLRLNGYAFLLGAGLIAYFPSNSKSTVNVSTINVSGTTESESESYTDKGFSYKNFMSAYFDIGYDPSGKEGRKEGLGWLVRLGLSLSDPVVTSDWINYQAYKHTTVSLVFNYSFAVAAFPIGGK
jgi:hypothetical protein